MNAVYKAETPATLVFTIVMRVLLALILAGLAAADGRRLTRAVSLSGQSDPQMVNDGIEATVDIAQRYAQNIANRLQLDISGLPVPSRDEITDFASKAIERAQRMAHFFHDDLQKVQDYIMEALQLIKQTWEQSPNDVKGNIQATVEIVNRYGPAISAIVQKDIQKLPLPDKEEIRGFVNRLAKETGEFGRVAQEDYQEISNHVQQAIVEIRTLLKNSRENIQVKIQGAIKILQQLVGRIADIMRRDFERLPIPSKGVVRDTFSKISQEASADLQKYANGAREAATNIYLQWAADPQDVQKNLQNSLEIARQYGQTYADIITEDVQRIAARMIKSTTQAS